MYVCGRARYVLTVVFCVRNYLVRFFFEAGGPQPKSPRGAGGGEGGYMTLVCPHPLPTAAVVWWWFACFTPEDRRADEGTMVLHSENAGYHAACVYDIRHCCTYKFGCSFRPFFFH